MPHQKSDKVPFNIYADLESLIQKIEGCKNNPEKSSAKSQVKIFHQIFQCLQHHHFNA